MNNTQLNRRTFVAGTALLAGSLDAVPLWAQSRLQNTKISIAVANQASFYHLPLTIAERLGYFKDEGLDLQIIDFDSSARALQAGLSGAAGVVSGAYEDTIKLQSMGQKFQAFVLQARAPAIAVGVSLKTLPNYKNATDLKGKRIGISALDSSTHRVVLMLLLHAGLNASEVSFMTLGNPADALAVFRSGQIDALCTVDPMLTMLEQKGEIRLIADTRTLKGSVAVFGGVMPASCLYASSAFVQKNPAAVQALANALVRSLRWLQTAGPSDIIKTVPESYLLGDRSLYLTAFNRVRESIATDGLIPEEGARTAVRVLARFDSAIKIDKIELAKTYTNEFARKASERFKV